MKSSLRVLIIVLLPVACITAIIAALFLHTRKDDIPVHVDSPRELTRDEFLALPRPWKQAARGARDGVTLISEGALASGLQRIEAGRYDFAEPYQSVSRELGRRMRQALSDRGLQQSAVPLDMLWIELGAAAANIHLASAEKNARHISPHRDESNFGAAIYIYQFFSDRMDDALASVEILSQSDNRPGYYVARQQLPELRALKIAIQTEGDFYEVATWRTLYLQRDLPGVGLHPLVALELWDDLLSRAETSYHREAAAAEIVRALIACGDEATARTWRDASPLIDLAYRAKAARLVRHRIRSRYMK